MLIFSLVLVLVELLTIMGFFTIKSQKTYLGPMLPPGDKNWQLLYPNCCFVILSVRHDAVLPTYYFNQLDTSTI